MKWDDTGRVKEGTIADLSTCATNKEGQILSATKFPRSGAGWDNRAYSTDYYAWLATAGRQFSKGNIPLPTEDFTCAGAATAGAVSWWKFAPHGLGMALTVNCGQVLVFIGRPKCSVDDAEACTYDSYDSFAIIELLDNQHFTPTMAEPAFWDSEMVLLSPGMTL